MTKIKQPILKSRNLLELTPESRLHGLELGVRIGVKNLGIGSTLNRVLLTTTQSSSLELCPIHGSDSEESNLWQILLTDG